MTILIYKSDSVKIYDTLLPNETFWGQSGLHYLKENQSVEFSGSLTFCVRFRYHTWAEGGGSWLGYPPPQKKIFWKNIPPLQEVHSLANSPPKLRKNVIFPP